MMLIRPVRLVLDRHASVAGAVAQIAYVDPGLFENPSPLRG